MICSLIVNFEGTMPLEMSTQAFFSASEVKPYGSHLPCRLLWLVLPLGSKFSWFIVRDFHSPWFSNSSWNKAEEGTHEVNHYVHRSSFLNTIAIIFTKFETYSYFSVTFFCNELCCLPKKIISNCNKRKICKYCGILCQDSKITPLQRRYHWYK